MAQLETNKPPKVRVNKRRSNENLTGWLFAMPWVIGLLLFFLVTRCFRLCITALQTSVFFKVVNS